MMRIFHATFTFSRPRFLLTSYLILTTSCECSIIMFFSLWDMRVALGGQQAASDAIFLDLPSA